MENYRKLNRDWWNKAVPFHMASKYYDVQGFLAGETSLQEAELSLLGDIQGKNVLHLQCHFGQDTISLARLGATVTGVDMADKGIEKARELAIEANQSNNVTFIACDIYDLPEILDEKFDIVFTSYGVLAWLSDLDKWGALICHFLKPGGKFIFVELHPVIEMFDEELRNIEHGYFQSEPIVDTAYKSYADKVAPIVGTGVTWNHGLAEVISSLIKNGIQINQFQEYDYSHYNYLPNTVEIGPKKYRINHWGNKIPMMYSIVGTKF